MNAKKVEVYEVQVYNILTGENVISLRMATLKVRGDEWRNS